MSGPSLADLKTYLGMTGTQDDTLIASSIVSAIAQAEADTGRRFAYASNTVQQWSSDGQTLVTVHDVPMTDATRVVTLGGVTVTEGTNGWFLPDRRNPAVSTTIQLYAFDRGSPDWYKSDPAWFDKNLDTTWNRRGNTPLDLRISGFVGHPVWRADVTQEVTFLAAWFYWRAKSGASGVIQTPTGEEIDLGAEPVSSPVFVTNWKVRPGIVGV